MARMDVDFLKPKANRKCASCFGTQRVIYLGCPHSRKYVFVWICKALN